MIWFEELFPFARSMRKDMLDGLPPEDLCLGQVLAFLCCISALQYAPREKGTGYDKLGGIVISCNFAGMVIEISNKKCLKGE